MTLGVEGTLWVARNASAKKCHLIFIFLWTGLKKLTKCLFTMTERPRKGQPDDKVVTKQQTPKFWGWSPVFIRSRLTPILSAEPALMDP